MTELAYRPDQTPQGASQERFVFVDPADRHAREFEIANTRPIAGDSPEVNAALEDALRIVEEKRDDAAAATPEQAATNAELTQAIDWNAATVKLTRDHTKTNGF